MDSRAASHAPSLLADGIDFIEDDDVQAAVSTKLVKEGITERSLFEYMIKRTNRRSKTKLSID